MRESLVPPSVQFNQSIIRTAERIIGTSLRTIQPIDHQNWWENHWYLHPYNSTNRSSELMGESLVPPSVQFNQSIIRTAERIIGTSIRTIQSIYQERTIKRTSNIIKDLSHPASLYFQYLPSGWLRAFKGNKRLIGSFFPSTIKTLNTNFMRLSSILFIYFFIISVVGPILFTIDSHSIIHHSFADDLQLQMSAPQIEYLSYFTLCSHV